MLDINNIAGDGGGGCMGDGGSSGMDYGGGDDFLHGGGSGGIARRPAFRLSIFNPSLTPDGGSGI